MKFNTSCFSEASIIVTKHARERLHERLPELCNGSFHDVIVNAVPSSVVVNARVEGDDIVLYVTNGMLGMVMKGHQGRMSVVTCVQSVLWEHKRSKKTEKYRKQRIKQLVGVM
jgi:hypothetical protein